MLASIRTRLIVVAILLFVSVWSLRPRSVTYRTGGGDRPVADTTVERFGLKTGLDLQGGMHLALEIDQSSGTVVNPEDALDRALTVIRSRIDEFGVGEPLIQKVGDSRIVVELPGIDDPSRARAIIERSAFLEFRITDMENRFRDVIPQIDAALRRSGIAARAQGTQTSTIEQLLGTDTVAESN